MKVSRFRQKYFFDFFYFLSWKKEKIENKSHFRHKLLNKTRKYSKHRTWGFWWRRRNSWRTFYSKCWKYPAWKYKRTDWSIRNNLEWDQHIRFVLFYTFYIEMIKLRWIEAGKVCQICKNQGCSIKNCPDDISKASFMSLPTLTSKQVRKRMIWNHFTTPFLDRTYE